MSVNTKFTVTDIVHAKYPWLRRIRSCTDLNDSVKEGDLGGFVESEANLSYEAGDEAWLYDNAIACGSAYVAKNAVLKDAAVAKDKAYISNDAILSGNAVAEDDSLVRMADMDGYSRVSGCGMVVGAHDTGYRPSVEGTSAVYGKIVGNYTLSGNTVIFPGEEIYNGNEDRLCLTDNVRSVIREPRRSELHPQKQRRRSQEHSR